VAVALTFSNVLEIIFGGIFFMGTKNTQIGDHQAAIGSPLYMAWLGTLPDFLKAIVAEERGIDLAGKNVPVMETHSLTSSKDKAQGCV
jgi:hypothetical protein